MEPGCGMLNIDGRPVRVVGTAAEPQVRTAEGTVVVGIVVGTVAVVQVETVAVVVVGIVAGEGIVGLQIGIEAAGHTVEVVA